MKLKNISLILIICLLLACSINAISAISDDKSTIHLNQGDDSYQLSINDNSVYNEQNNDLYEVDGDINDVAMEPQIDEKQLSPYQKFADDLDNWERTVYLNGNIKISHPFEIRNHNVIIDGQGHTIDGQSKTNMFKVYRCTVTFKNITFKNGFASKGGAVYAYMGNLNFYGCTFLNNRANDGGAVYQSHGTCTVKGSTFKSNKVLSGLSRGHGGAIYVYAGHAKIFNSIFKSNSCISTKLKKHSKATKYQFAGGAIYICKGSKHVLSGCTFESNKASNHGGAVYVYQSKDLKINKCIFRKNRAVYEDGGAITFNSNKKLYLKNSKFYYNLAYEDGGVMDALSQTKSKTFITVIGCKFIGNVAYKAGGVFWMGLKTVFTIKNSNFIKNKASVGGVLLGEDTNAKLTRCVFQGNKAAKVTKWGARSKAGLVLKHIGGVAISQKRVMKFYRCTFKSNSATYGGILFKQGGKISFSKCKYSHNKAKKGNKIYPGK